MKISVLAFLVFEIAMKKTLNLGFGRRPQDNFNIFSIFLLVRLKSSCKQKISQLACLIMNIAMKKTLKLGFGRRPQENFNFWLNISSSKVKIKLKTENQPNSLLNNEDSYEEDLKIWILKTTSNNSKFLSTFILVR